MDIKTGKYGQLSEVRRRITQAETFKARRNQKNEEKNREDDAKIASLRKLAEELEATQN